MYIHRKLEKVLQKYLKIPEIIVVTGPRQSGKTTLIRFIQSNLKKSVYLSFEDIETLELFEKDTKNFMLLYEKYKYIFIDEFQYSKNGGKLLKFIFDTYPGKKIIISGSSAVDITINAVKHLTGRIFVFNLYQFDFEEFLSYKDEGLFKIYLNYIQSFNSKSIKMRQLEISEILNKKFYKLLNEFLIFGGYPRVITSGNIEEKKLVLKNIYNTYFLREVRDIIGLTDDFKLARLLKLLAGQTGNLINYNELSVSSGYDFLTLKKYLNIIDKTYICKLIAPFSGNKRTEINKNPKIYFYDNGLRNQILNSFAVDTDKGKLFENFIFSQLLKKDIDVKFWRTKTKAEVDFIFSESGKITAVENKSVLRKMIVTKAVYSFIEKYSPDKILILNETIIGNSEKFKNLIYLPHWLI